MQTEVKSTLAIGSAGDILKAEHNYMLLESAVASGDDIAVGNFVQQGSTEGEVINASGVAISSFVLGVVTKSKMQTNSETPSVLVKRGDNVTYISKGVVLIETTTPAIKGQVVFLKNDDGSLVFNDTGTLADHTNTNWRVLIGTNDSTAIDAGGTEIIAIVRD